MRHPNLAKLAQRGGRGGFGINVNVAKMPRNVFPSASRPPSRSVRSNSAMTDACAPTPSSPAPAYYDGDQFPPEMHGNVFVPDSAGHLVGT
jgi:hypothetical protein